MMDLGMDLVLVYPSKPAPLPSLFVQEPIIGGCLLSLTFFLGYCPIRWISLAKITQFDNYKRDGEFVWPFFENQNHMKD
jgi:hypothetical protein